MSTTQSHWTTLTYSIDYEDNQSRDQREFPSNLLSAWGFDAHYLVGNLTRTKEDKVRWIKFLDDPVIKPKFLDYLHKPRWRKAKSHATL